MKKTTKKTPEPPKTAVGNLMYFFEELSTFVHPRITEAMKKLVWDARTEMAKEAKDQVFDQDLQALEPLLKEYRESMRRYGTTSRPQHIWHMRPIIQKIIDSYGPGT